MSASKSLASWGTYETIHKDDNCWTRTLTIYAGESLSLHYHQFRKELWVPLETGLQGIINGGQTLDLIVGHVYDVPQNVLHRILNPSGRDLRLIEVSVGKIEDADIIHIYDKHRS